MKVYIELLIIIAAILIFLVWLMWYKFSKRRLNKEYKPENDRGRKGTESKQFERGKPRVKESVSSDGGLGEPARRKLLQETKVNDGRTEDHINGETDSSNRKIRFFRRNKK